jgi:uncharacterized peroxidase-related enzyme
VSRLPLPDFDALPEDAQDLIQQGEVMMGFAPNDALAMARNPEMLSGVSAMVMSIYGPGELEPGLKRLIGYIASTAAGCVYCQQHSTHGALKSGVEAEKLREAWSYETSDLFSDAEQAALKLAHLGSLSPSQVSDADFAAARAYFTDAQMVEIVGVISMFGFLNRWNAIMATDIEAKPKAAFEAAGMELK